MDDDGIPEERGPGAEPRPLDLQEAATNRLFGPTDFHNIEAEAALLGALMIDNRLALDLGALQSSHFFEPLHDRIFHTIQRFVANGKTASPITLRPIFLHDTEMAELGGPAYLAQLTGSGAAIIGARDFADQIVELARMRRLYAAMIDSVRKMQDGTSDIAEAIDTLEQEIWEVSDIYRPMKVHTAHQMFGMVEERIERIQQQATKQVGARSKTVPEINSLVGGLEGGQYTILAGRPSMGKTTAAVSFSWGCAANGHPVLYAHAEMSAEMMSLKVATDICHASGAPLEFKLIRDGLLNRKQLADFERGKEQANQLPIRFADIGRADILRVEAAVARNCAYWEARDRKLELVVVDYIGLIGAEGSRPGDDRVRVGRVSKALLDIAKKYDVHVLALAQLSRKVEDRVATDRRPMLSDLRDSGDLEQDADNVLFVHRPEFYLIDEKPRQTAKNYESAMKDWEIDMAEWRNKIEIIGGKTRFGSKGSRRARFYGEFSAVRSLAWKGIDGEDDDDGEDLFMGNSV